MPRTLRIEYPGAVYHILNRGNYRQSVFATEGSKKSFEQTLFESCRKYHWVLHSFCIMSNHYHLALETTNGSLSDGMQWLQSTFANRFNRLRKSNGHLFQGRFKSLIVDKDEYLGPLVHYIHLNPVRARIVTNKDLYRYRWSSLWYLNNKRKRPDYLNISSCLYYAGDLADTSRGRGKYLEYLAWLSEENQRRKDLAFEKMSQGWALGTKEFKKELLSEHAHLHSSNQWTGTENLEARELLWENILECFLKVLGKNSRDILLSRKSSLWKVKIAYYMKKHTGASNGWLSEKLNMGVAHAVSRYTAMFEKNNGHKKKEYKKLIARITA